MPNLTRGEAPKHAGRGTILSLNAGSSSLKFALFAAVTGRLQELARGEISELGSAPHLLAHDPTGQPLADRRWPAGGQRYAERQLCHAGDLCHRDRADH